MDVNLYKKFWLLTRNDRKAIVTMRVRSVFDVNYLALKKAGIKLLVFDVDDTLTDHLGILQQDSLKLLKKLIRSRFSIGILSNCAETRRLELDQIFSGLGVYNSRVANKPNPQGYLEICEYFQIKPENAAMLGEKKATDMYGGFLAGFRERILVAPFSRVFGGKRAFALVRLLRNIENKY